MYRIGICGAHGTGKTTLGTELSELLNLPFITNTMRAMWKDFGITDFEKLPADIRTGFQKHAILRQIQRENIEGSSGFITDRTVIDNLGYTQLSSDMSGIDLELYIGLAIERIKNYTHIIYLPIMFDAPAEDLRANLDSRAELADIIKRNIAKYIPAEKVLKVTTLAHEDRIDQVLKFIKL